MIYINGKLVDFDDRTDSNPFKPVVKEYHDFVNTMKYKHGDVLLFLTPSSKLRLDPISKAPVPPKGWAWPFSTTLVDGVSPQKWTYSKNAAPVKDGVVDIAESHFHIMDSKSISLTEDPDLAFFLTKIRAYRRGHLWIHDPGVEDEKQAQALIEATKVQTSIYGEESVLYKDVKKLRSIAGKWGVVVTDTMSNNAVRNALFAAVNTGEDNKKKGKPGSRGYADFLSDIRDEGSLKIAGNIQAAVDKGLLLLNRQTGEWQLTIANGEMPLPLMTAGMVAGDVARARLLDYLEKNPGDAELLEKVISGEVVVKYGQVQDRNPEDKVILPGDVTIDNIDEVEDGKNVVNVNMLKKTAKALGLNSFGKKEAELRAMVRQELEQLARTT